MDLYLKNQSQHYHTHKYISGFKPVSQTEIYEVESTGETVLIIPYVGCGTESPELTVS